MQWQDGWKCHTYAQAHLLSFLSTNWLVFCPVNKCSFLSIQSLSLDYDKYWTKLGLLTTYWLDFVLKMPIPHLKIRTNAGQNLDICPVLVQKQFVHGQIEDKFGTGIQFLSHFCPPAGWPGWKWKNDSVPFLSSICPHHLPWTDRTKWGQKWDNFETNDDKI